MQTGDVASRRRRRKQGYDIPATKNDTRQFEELDQEPNNGDYYDDSDTDIKGNPISHDDKMYGGACSFGQFMLNPCLCMLRCGHRGWTRIRRSTSKKNKNGTSLPLSKGKLRRQSRAKMENLINRFLFLGVIAFAIVSTFCFLSWILSFVTTKRIIVGRATTDEQVDAIPIVLNSLDFKRLDVDIGRWTFYRQFFRPETPVENMLHTPGYYEHEFVGPFGEARKTRADDLEVSENYWLQLHSDTRRIHSYDEYTEDLKDTPQKCYRQSWMQLYNPSCNAFHELDIKDDYKEDEAGLGHDQMLDTFFINNGYWRDVWVVHQKHQDIKSILKTLRWKHIFEIDTYWGIVRDAQVMERLTKSPRIVDIYGHCGYSVWVEAIPFEVEEYVVPQGYIKQEELRDEEELKPQNDFDDEEKLEKALVMAESLADLHGFEDGLIVHDDVQLCQWLQTKDGNLKLGDFNRAEVPLFDPMKQEYCKYNNGHGYGNYRAPEEFAAQDLDEQIDVFSFGNNIYGLLTGLWVFYENEDDGVVQKKLKSGETAYIDERWRTHSFVTGRLVEIMEKCWAYKTEDRITIFEAVRLLRAIKEEYSQQEHEAARD